jgi:hypothetical protein
MSDFNHTVLELLAFCGKGLANSTLKDVYEQLKNLLKAKILGTSTVQGIDPEVLLTQYEQNPEIWQGPMQAALAEAQVDKDEEIMTAAKHLLDAVKPSIGTGTVQNFNNNASGTQINNVNIDNKTVSNHSAYYQESEFFDKVREFNGLRTRTTYRRNPATGGHSIEGIELE